jgi:hypothetical protein
MRTVKILVLGLLVMAAGRGRRRAARLLAPGGSGDAVPPHQPGCGVGRAPGRAAGQGGPAVLRQLQAATTFRPKQQENDNFRQELARLRTGKNWRPGPERW